KMNKSEHREHRISINDHISEETTSSDEETALSDNEISQVDLQNPHNRKKIEYVVCSPNKKYVASASLEDSSVRVWTITEDVKTTEENPKPELKLVCSFEFKDIDLKKPIRISNSMNLLIGNCIKHSLSLEIRDIINKNKMILNAQEIGGKGISKVPNINDKDTKIIGIFNAQKYLKGRIDCTEFLGNGDLVVIEGDPAYQAHIISEKKKSVALHGYHQTHIPFVIMQWNLLTRKFEAQYELDWSLASWKSISMKLNCNAEHLAVAGNLNETSKSKVYFYSTKSRKMIKDVSFMEKFGDISDSSDETNIHMNFITLKSVEFLFVYFQVERFYVIDLSFFLKSTIKLKHDLSVGNTIIISNRSQTPGYIIRSDDQMEIESLSLNTESPNSKDEDDNVDEIKEIIMNTYGTYKEVPEIGQYKKPKYYEGQQYTWIVEYYEVSVDKLAKYLKKIENEGCDEALRQLLPTIEKVVEREKSDEKKFAGIYKKLDELMKSIKQGQK
ncbi:4495_t:CDS:2, partial [Acaulospora morrowiae]